MTFLNPAVLWGLAALAVPIIIHFFNLQRPKQILFSNVAFVKEVKKTIVKRVKFKQWLLLLARLLAITALVLAFANPVITGDSNKILQGNRSIAIVIDNSYSMQAGNEKGTYFQQATSLARNIARAYGRQDEYLLMSSSDLKLNFNFMDQDQFIDELKNIEIEQNIRPHTELLGFKDEIFSRASNKVKELYFLSDFQRSTVMIDSLSRAISDSGVIIKYIPFATRSQKNVYVKSSKISSQILEKGKPVDMSMVLVNDGEAAIKDLSVRVLLNGKVEAINNTSIDGGEEAKLSLSFTPKESGWLDGYIELDDNPVGFDNQRFFTLYVPEKEKVLVVEGQPSPNVSILYKSLFTQFEPQFITAREISSVQLNDYKSLVILGISDISSGLSDKLKTFLNEGGSILMFPGKDVNISSMNNFLSSVKVGQIGPAISIQEGTKAEQADLDHPIFDGVFSRTDKSRRLDAPTIFQYYPLKLNNSQIQNRILSINNQAPILVESKVGNGLFYLFSTFPGDAWTDLHVKTIFTPIMFRATQIMNQTQNVQIGQEIGFFQPKAIRTNKKSLISLVDSEGNSIPPEQYAKGGATTLNFDKMDLTQGNYDIVQEDELLEKIAFNISDLESRLDFVKAREIEEYLNQKGFKNIEVLPPLPDTLSQQIQQEKEGIPLWKFFLIGALAFLVVEVAILLSKNKTA